MFQQSTTNDSVEGVKEVRFGGDKNSSDENPQSSDAETSISSFAVSKGKQRTPSPDDAESSDSSDLRGQSSTVFSEMAQTISQAVEAALLNLEHRRADEIKAVNDRLQDLRLDEVVQAWTETLRETAELKGIVAEQDTTLAAVEEKLLQLAAVIENAGQDQAGRVGLILERLTVQETELSNLENLIDDLSRKLNLLVQRVDLQTKIVRSVYEAEKQRETTLQQLSDIAVGLKTSLPSFPKELSDGAAS